MQPLSTVRRELYSVVVFVVCVRCSLCRILYGLRGVGLQRHYFIYCLYVKIVSQIA